MSFERKVSRILNPSTRKAVYLLAASIGSLLIYYGHTTEQEVVVWGAVFTQVFPLVLALLNVPETDEPTRFKGY